MLSAFVFILSNLSFSAGELGAGAVTELGRLQGLLVDRHEDLTTVIKSGGQQPLAGHQKLLLRQLDRLRRVLNAKLTETDSLGLGKLHMAVIDHSPERLRKLIAAGLDLEATAGDLSVRPLHLSVLSGDRKQECLKALLDVRLPPPYMLPPHTRLLPTPAFQLPRYTRSTQPLIPHSLPIQQCRPQTPARAWRSPSPCPPRSDASPTTNPTLRLLQAGADPDPADARGTTPLLAAAALNLPRCASCLLHHGAEPGKAGANGVTPLHLAAWVNAAEVAQVLLANGATPDATDDGGRAASHAACVHDACEVLELLLDAGASPEQQDIDGRRPIHYAVQACTCTDPRCPRIRSLRFLIENGAAMGAEDHEGWTSLVCVMGS
jgi:hypothetical protein